MYAVSTNTGPSGNCGKFIRETCFIFHDLNDNLSCSLACMVQNYMARLNLVNENIDKKHKCLYIKQWIHIINIYNKTIGISLQFKFNMS